MISILKNDFCELKRKLSDYPALLKASKKRLIFACVFSLLMLVITASYIPAFSVKSLVICVFCAAFSGIFIGFPNFNVNKHVDTVINIFILFIFAVVAPSMLYVRTEIVVHDLSGLVAGTKLLNLMLMLALFGILLLFTQKISLALGIEGIILLLLTITNYYVFRFRGTGLSFYDFAAIKTAALVMGNYDYSISAELWKSICYYLLFITLAFRIRFDFKGIVYHIAISAAVIISLCICILFFNFSSMMKNPILRGENGNILAGEHFYGLYYYLYLSASTGGMERPDSYSDSEMNNIKAYVEEHYEADFAPTVSKPNIILIMNEAWGDAGILGPFETTDPVSPFIDSLKTQKNTAFGYTFVNVFGGLTANSEYEALTGDSLTLLNPSSVPYQMQVNHDMPSLATVLSEQGYSTLAMHPNVPISWNRGKVYSYFGFDEAVFFDDFETEKEYIGTVVSDSSNYREVIHRFEKRDTNKPLFLFDVTIQNHSPYGEQIPFRLTTHRIGEKITNEFYEVNEYLSLLNESDRAFQELVEYFSMVNEPVIICMFGDHQALLPERFYGMMFENSGLSDRQIKDLEYRTPYIIWANYDISLPAYGDINASYLPSLLCEISGNKLPVYYRFLSILRQNYGAFNIYSDENIMPADIKNMYRILQYNRLIDRNIRGDIFLTDK